MSESFVDLTYRGLQLGRRVKLAQVRPSTGYLEMPAPMPVGTTIAVTTDDGVAFDAIVNAIHEQTGGTDKPPGMTVAPQLSADAVKTWWQARVTLPELEPVRERKKTEKQPKLAKPDAAPAPVPVAPTTKPYAAQVAPATIPETASHLPPADDPQAAIATQTIPINPVSDAEVMAAAAAMAGIPEPIAPSRSKPVTLRPRSKTQQVDEAPTTQGPPVADRAASRSDAEATTLAAPIAVDAEPSIPEIIDDGKKTQVMDSIDPNLLEQLVAQSRPTVQGGPLGEDESTRTTAMDAVDLAALGLDPNAGKSGSMAAVPAATDDETSDAVDTDSKPASRNSSTSVQRRKRNPKRR